MGLQGIGKIFGRHNTTFHLSERTGKGLYVTTGSFIELGTLHVHTISIQSLCDLDE